ncbi:MAG: hypothetical protein SAK29_00655 [Scytonema sp. PMC 1069.18]|nr:hypothetical protein [Scytonema sp. PMC 1069.18]MEC4883947.1 hypothetical protein [Scytonema sp. PMC 1070.18]
MSKSVDTRVNELVMNKETGSFNYKVQKQKGVGLRVSDDDEMAVPNVLKTEETKDFYTTESVLKKSKETMAFHESMVDLEKTGEKIQVNGKELMRIQPVNSKEKTKNKELDNVASIRERCIEMAYAVATGGKDLSSGKPMLKTGLSEVKIEYERTTEKDLNYAEKFPEEDAKKLGFNEYASPEVGEMMATFSLIKRKDNFPYHFAAVIAKSGEDYVTLENYNRKGSVQIALDELWDTLVKTHKWSKEYQDNLNKMTEQNYSNEFGKSTLKGFDEITDKDEKEAIENNTRVQLIQENNRRESLIQSLVNTATKAEEAEELISNAWDNSVLSALWYFQMYGPVNQKVALTDSQGQETEINQSFHAHMESNDVFEQPLTLRIPEEIIDVSTDTLGIEPKVKEIIEPEQPEGIEKLLGALSHLVGTGRQANMLKQEAITLAQSPNVQEKQIKELESKLPNIGDSRTAEKAKYTLQVLRLLSAIQKKTTEIKEKTIELKGLQERSNASGLTYTKSRMKLDKVVSSNLLSSFQTELDYYRITVEEVLKHQEYQNTFPKSMNDQLKSEVDKMEDKLDKLRALFEAEQKRLFAMKIYNTFMENRKLLEAEQEKTFAMEQDTFTQENTDFALEIYKTFVK